MPSTPICPNLCGPAKRVAIYEQLEDPKLTKIPKQEVVETVTPNQTPKVEQLSRNPPEPVKEIETDGSPDYSDNPDPRLLPITFSGTGAEGCAKTPRVPLCQKKEKEEKPVEKAETVG